MVAALIVPSAPSELLTTTVLVLWVILMSVVTLGAVLVTVMDPLPFVTLIPVPAVRLAFFHNPATAS